MSEEPSPVSEPTQVPKTKKPRSEQQLAVLARAREKALAVRQENAEIRRKEKELESAKKKSDFAERKARVETEHAQMSDPSDLEPTEEVRQRKPKVVHRKVVVVESESDSDHEEIEVRTKRKKAPPPETGPEPDPLYASAYSKMFDF